MGRDGVKVRRDCPRPFEPDTELGAFHLIRLVRHVFVDRGGYAEHVQCRLGW
jgi:hypothetical protein